MHMDALSAVNERLDLSPQPLELELNIFHALCRPRRSRTGRGIAQGKVRQSETRCYDSTTGPTSDCLTAASFEIVSLKRVNKDSVPLSSKNRGLFATFR